MSIKLRILCVISALCFLGSVACFSGYAAECLYNPSGDEEIPAEPSYVEPVPSYTEPVPSYTEPDPSEPVPSYPTSYPVDPDPSSGEVSQDPGTVSQDPVSTDPGEVSQNPGEEDPTNSEVTTSDVISDGNFPQDTSSSYVDNTSEYNQYISNTNNAQYDDNYLYIPSYTAPEEKLIETSSKSVDTDELTAEDWARIMLDLDNGNSSGGGNNSGSKTFSFIKDNIEEGDTSIEWMLYLGVALILLSIFTVIFVIISTSNSKRKFDFA